MILSCYYTTILIYCHTVMLHCEAFVEAGLLQPPRAPPPPPPPPRSTTVIVMMIIMMILIKIVIPNISK